MLEGGFAAADADEWHLYTGTFSVETSIQTLYRDGIKVAERTASSAPATFHRITVGSRPTPADSQRMHGSLDNVRVHVGRALTGNDAIALFLGDELTLDSRDLAATSEDNLLAALLSCGPGNFDQNRFTFFNGASCSASKFCQETEVRGVECSTTAECQVSFCRFRPLLRCAPSLGC
jgi:hypothetical protein